MAAKSDRGAAGEAVAAYHAHQLAVLLEHVGSAFDQFRGGELDAFEVDHVVLHYSRAAKELWKFCSLGDPELLAGLTQDHPPTDWWKRATPSER